MSGTYTKDKTVIVGLSGGVDSSTCLYLLKQHGYNPIGVTMEIYKGTSLPNASEFSCYGHEKQDIPQIQSLCDTFQIPYYHFDCTKEFHNIIIEYFKTSYLNGQTPNPCIKCNELIKFALLPQKSKEAGLKFSHFATGHYARIIKHSNGLFYLKKAADTDKDQSYFLYRLNQNQLATTLFPLGEQTKKTTRNLARENIGEIGNKKDSQDFYSGDYSDILNIPQKQGNIIDTKGNILGTHQGFWNYTSGQRKGLGIAYKNPLYVIDVNPLTNEVIVGDLQETLKSTVTIKDYFFHPVSQQEITGKIRSTQKEKNIINLTENRNTNTLSITFSAPLNAVSKGQSVVLYQDDLVIGGGIII